MLIIGGLGFASCSDDDPAVRGGGPFLVVDEERLPAEVTVTSTSQERIAGNLSVTTFLDWADVKVVVNIRPLAPSDRFDEDSLVTVRTNPAELRTNSIAWTERSTGAEKNDVMVVWLIASDPTIDFREFAEEIPLMWTTSEPTGSAPSG